MIELTFCLLFAAAFAVTATVSYIFGKASGYKEGFHTARKGDSPFDTGCYSAFVSARVFAERMEALPDAEWRAKMERHLDECIWKLETRVMNYGKEKSSASGPVRKA